MNTVLTKVTIVTENILRDEIVAMIKEQGSTGYTLTMVEVEGSRGVRASDWEGRNICIETLVSATVADVILEKLNTPTSKTIP